MDGRKRSNMSYATLSNDLQKIVDDKVEEQLNSFKTIDPKSVNKDIIACAIWKDLIVNILLSNKITPIETSKKD